MLSAVVVPVSWLWLVASEWSFDLWKVAAPFTWWFYTDSFTHFLSSEFVLVSTTSSEPELGASSFSGVVVPGLKNSRKFLPRKIPSLQAYQFIPRSTNISSILWLVARHDLVWGNCSTKHEWSKSCGWASSVVRSEGFSITIWAATVSGKK